MKFLKKLIGLGDRPRELYDGELEALLKEEPRPVVVEFYGHG